MKRRILTVVLVLIFAFSMTTSALAQDYSFSLDREVVNVYWNEDGTMSLDYLFTFTNQPGAHEIDFVDVGLPNDNFVFTSVTADVNGNPVAISRDYQGSGSGIAVDLGRYAIQPGQTGTVHVFVGRISNVVYPDDQDENYASAVFSPTWFGSQFVVGDTDLTVTFHLPPGVQPDEPRWHGAPSGFPSEPQTGFDNEGRVTYTWSNPSASGSRQYTFGASFPKTYIPESAIVTPPAFDFGGLVSTILASLGPLLFCGFFIFMFFGVPVLTYFGNQRRKLQYMSPKIAIEGHGIKRGLTAVEAAILMEQPLDKVMTMILFGVVKKGAATVVDRDPLLIEAISPVPSGLHEYEQNFLRAVKETEPKRRRELLQDMTVKLVKSLSEKMKGFSRRETIEYYRRIMETAWEQVQKADTPEIQREFFEQQLEWTMLDRDYDDRSRRVFQGPVFVPWWWGNYDPTYRTGPITRPGGGGVSSVPTPSTGSGRTSLPGADFAASVVGGVQTFSQKVIGNINDFTSRVTNVTNPPPKPSSTGGRRTGGGGGGRSCACACACAGCACACAGGGR
ncbi:MAG TPA: hypothetical protein VK897_04665 [Anaerolineales bacterium]|nr:hypothetical protein [Anaerolineales bacterium]